MIDIHINIGSNSGHREALIGRAVAAVASSFPGAQVRRSDIVETAPWGFDSPNPFLNVGVVMHLADEAVGFGGSASGSVSDLVCGSSDIRATVRPYIALEVLRRLLAIQAEIDPSPHRDASGGYIDRAIDIDLIAIDDWTVELPDLILPHPRMHLRDFVLIPLRQLAPDWRHPIIGKNPAEMMNDLK